MKTEEQIAKEQVSFYKKVIGKESKHCGFQLCLRHKLTCQRWLKSLKEEVLNHVGTDKPDCVEEYLTHLTGVVIDLKEAIKLYGVLGHLNETEEKK